MNNLWKKEADGGNYVDIFKNIETSAISSGNGLQKNNEISTRLRNKGKQEFQEHYSIEAMDYGNRSLCFAEIGTDNVNLAYGNRASSFLKLKKYEKCLADIDMAKSTDTTNVLSAKLMTQMTDAIKRIKRKREEPQAVFERKLSFGASKQFSCLADVVEIQQNEEFGRHAVAMRDLPVDQTILVEESFLSTTLSGILIGCATCQKTQMNFIACDKCTMAIFCDEKCKEYNGLHKYDCNFIYDRDQAKNKEFQMIAHSIFFALNTFGDVDELVEFIENSIGKGSTLYVPESLDDAVSKYRLFLTHIGFVDIIDMQSILINSKHLYTVLLKLPAISNVFDNEQKQLVLMHLVTMHDILVCQNSIIVKRDEGQRIATLSLVCPLFNHACSPNLLNYSINGLQLCITIRPIKKGDQLFVSYSCDDLPTEDRQIQLMQHYGFHCKCDKCEPKYTADDVAKLVAESGFKYVKRNLNSNITDKKIRTEVKKKCIKLLNKYGHVWMPELEIIMDMYIKTELHEY